MTVSRLQHNYVRQRHFITSLIFHQRVNKEAKIFLLSACQIMKFRAHWLITFELYEQPQDSYVMALQLIHESRSHCLGFC